MLGTHPLDAFVGDVGASIVIGIGVHIDSVHVVVKPDGQVSLATSVEALNAAIHGPTVEWSDNAGFPGPKFVAFAKHGGVETVQPQDLGQHRDAVGTHRGIPRKSSGILQDHAEVRAMAVAPSEQGHAAGRTQRGHLEVVVAKPVLGQSFQRWHVDRAAECGRLRSRSCREG